MRRKFSAVEHRSLLTGAILQFKLALAARFLAGDHGFEFPYLAGYSWGKHTQNAEQLSLSKAQEELAGSILEHTATYILVLQVDRDLQDLIPDRFQNPDSNLKAAAGIARLARNAFAHNPLAPTWEFQPEAANKIFHVSEILTLHTAGLDGKPVERTDYGGPLALLALAEFIMARITQ